MKTYFPRLAGNYEATVYPDVRLSTCSLLHTQSTLQFPEYECAGDYVIVLTYTRCVKLHYLSRADHEKSSTMDRRVKIVVLMLDLRINSYDVVV